MISEPEWASIAAMIEKISSQVSGKRQDYFTTGPVIKVDVPNRCVYLAEFGDQAIPIVAYDYAHDYYVTDQSGNTVKKTAVSKVKMPKPGDTVVVAREYGTRGLPRALGVLQGTNWILSEDEQ